MCRRQHACNSVNSWKNVQIKGRDNILFFSTLLVLLYIIIWTIIMPFLLRLRTF